MAGKTVTSGRPLASLGGLELAVPECPKGIGALIGAADSAERSRALKSRRWRCTRTTAATFSKCSASVKDWPRAFPPDSSQVSAALSYAGTIKAFHYHLRQTDCWTPAKGLFQVALVDLRLGSPTFGKRNTMYVGPLRPWQILIPPAWVTATR